MKNAFEVRGDVTAIIIKSPKYGSHEVLISTSKLERAKEFPNSWYVSWSGTKKDFYVTGQLPRVNGKRKSALLHRWLTNAPAGMQVDHVDGSTLNNRNENLRIVTNAENNQNRIGATSLSKSGVRGVVWIEKRLKWLARVGLNGKLKHIGYYAEKLEAERAVKEARAKFLPFSNDAREVG